MSTSRTRLDLALVQRGLVETRTLAQAAIESGVVLVNGSIAQSASRAIALADQVVVSAPAKRFVSRGGEKLDRALDVFGMQAANKVAVDAGASTGGFTDCLLKRGASLVYAIDVGYGQLDHRLRVHPQVIVRERTNIRSVTGGDLHEPHLEFLGADLVVADLSFISLTLPAPALAGLLKVGGNFAVLVKPQFEADRATVSAGKGVLRNPEDWRRAMQQVAASFAKVGMRTTNATVSPIHGPKGNTEFLLGGLRVQDDDERELSATDVLIDEAVDAGMELAT